jgi:acetyl-CoA C-acetyltransferase
LQASALRRSVVTLKQKVEGACASGGIAFRHAYLAVACGLCDVALAVGVEKMTHATTAVVTSALNCALDMHAHRYGTTRSQVSAVVRKNKANGLLNPLAQMGAALSEEDIAQSRPICDPLRVFDCCPVSDGAAAVVLAAEHRRSEIGSLPVHVLASVQTRGKPRVGGHADLCTFEATVSAARQAYSDANLSPADIDFVELHDCFSIAEVIDSEDLGITPRGQGAAFAAEGRTAVGGDRPINPSGGLLAKGHPVGATGLGQIYEAVLQLRGIHPNQVRDAAIGLTHNLGGTGVACTVNIFKRADV